MGNVVREGGEDMHLQVIFTAPIEIDLSFELPVYKKTDEQAKFINDALANIEEEERNTLINTTDEYSVVAGNDTIKQGNIRD
eukprot:5428531-Ditylum_brightwellii.AAC.1